MTHTLQTKRLILRSLEVGDVSQRYVDWLNDPAVNQFLETRYVVQTLESCRNFVTECNNSPAQHLFGVFLKSDGSHIGNAKLGFVNTYHRRAQISLFIGEKSQWGKGLGLEIVISLTRFGFDNLELERIEAGCHEGNLGSLRLFLNVGYKVEGFFRSHNLGSTRRTGAFWLGILRHEFDGQ